MHIIKNFQARRSDLRSRRLQVLYSFSEKNYKNRRETFVMASFLSILCISRKEGSIASVFLRILTLSVPTPQNG